MTALFRDDLLEPPIRVGAAREMERRRRETRGFAHGGPEARVAHVLLQPRGGTSEPDPRPAPQGVDVVRQRDRETRTAG